MFCELCPILLSDKNAYTCTYVQLCVQLVSDQGILPVMGYDNYSMSFNRLQTSTEVVYQAHGSILQLTDAAMMKLRG